MQIMSSTPRSRQMTCANSLDPFRMGINEDQYHLSLNRASVVGEPKANSIGLVVQQVVTTDAVDKQSTVKLYVQYPW